MGYQEALEVNGVEVTTFKEFGSYQGTWIAVLADGRFIEGSYGSCSGCDAFQGEFGWNDNCCFLGKTYHPLALLFQKPEIYTKTKIFRRIIF